MDNEHGKGGECVICGGPHETGACFKVGSEVISDAYIDIEDFVARENNGKKFDDENFDYVKRQLDIVRGLIQESEDGSEAEKLSREEYLAHEKNIVDHDKRIREIFENFIINGNVADVTKLYKGSPKEIHNENVDRVNRYKEFNMIGTGKMDLKELK